ncbi:MAG: LPS assembly protein LptD, partial [Planctomycetes bacterium]|nr:LPS assembly protein LptD [Planctomycetota bacterium]
QVVVAPGAPGVAAATAPDGAEPTGPGEAIPAPPAGPPVLIRFHADETRSVELVSEAARGQRVVICKGNVYVSRGEPGGAAFMEMRADAAVLFTAGSQIPPGGGGGDLADRPGRQRVYGAYLEGDVIVTAGERSMRSSRLYYDFTDDRGIILDAVVRIVQAARNIPIIIRASEARQLSRREVSFRNGRISTSEFHTPSYHIGAASGYLADTTPYDAKGEPLAESSFSLKAHHSTFNIGGVLFFYWPLYVADAERADLPLSRVQLGNSGRFGFGVESDWHLFRVLGLIAPQGVSGILNLDAFEKATAIGADVEYDRQSSSGLLIGYAVKSHERDDDFAEDRENIPAPADRGRFLWRHKQFLPDDWQIQAELSYLSDRNFLERYYRDEYYTGKDQDTLLYAKKQRDNWAITGLVQGRLNDFTSTTEAMPDVGLHLIGQPLADGALTFTGQTQTGLVRFRADNEDPLVQSTGTTFQHKTRAELTAPMHFGPVNVAPYALGMISEWCELGEDNDTTWLTGGGGVRANMHIWRVYEGAHSRLLDIDRLRHVITPEAVAVALGLSDQTEPVAFQAVKIGVKQRWQTYRGSQAERRVVDFARMNVWGLFFNETRPPDRPADGRLFFDRPEESITRNALNGDFAVNFSDTTVLMGDMNYDLNDREIGLANLGLAVQRDPRLRYYLGMRYTDDLNSWVGTAGFNYEINRKYRLGVFQQYDFDFDGGENLVTRISIIRKLPRWFAGITLAFDRATGATSVMLTLWPEGAPEFRIGGIGLGELATGDLN